MIVGFYISPYLFSILGTKDSYLQDSNDYISVILYRTIFFMINISLNTILVSRGDTKSYRNFLIIGFYLFQQLELKV